MEFSVNLEQPQVSGQEPSLQHLLVQLSSPPIDDGQRTPLRVALAIDRSKSMYGEKLQSVIEAATALVNWLTRNDSLAVIAYDTNVEVIQPLLPLTDKFSVIERIQSIKAGSATNLSGGWLQALRMVEDEPVQAGQPGFRRVILLTDGMANSGIVNPKELAAIALDHFQRNISTTTMGFGRDFSESTLRSIASAGGGNFYFIEGPEQAGSVFFEEFGEIAALYGQGLEIRLNFAPGVIVQEILNEIPHEQNGDELILRPGDVRSDDSMNIVLVLQIDGKVIDTSQPIVSAQCSFYDVRNGAKMERLSAAAHVAVGQSTTQFNREVRLEALVASTSRALLEASRLSAERDLSAARELIKRKRSQIEASFDLAPALLKKLHERLGVTERNLGDNQSLLSKRLMAEADSLSRREIRRVTHGHDRIFELAISGQIDLYRCPDLKASARRAIDNGYRFAIFDLNEVAYIDSSGIGALIQIFNWLKSRGGLLLLTNVQSGVERIFQMGKLDEFFMIRESPISARMMIEDLLSGQP